MHKFRPIISTRFSHFCLAIGTVSGIAALGLGGQTAWADSSCTPPNNGPTGPAATTFTYQCDGTYAGDWTNAYYVYDPSTETQTALYSPDYTYDCTTGTWTQAEWDYDTTTGAYVEDQVPAATTPDQSTNCATTNDSNTSSADASSGTAVSTTTPATSPDASDSEPTNTPANTVAPTAPPDPSSNCPTPDTSSSADTGVATDSASLNNDACSQSQSGDAAVTNNGSAGDATSGDATTEVNIANLVQTLSNALGTGTVTFTTNIDGDVNGDLVLDPSTILADAAGDGSSNSSGTDGDVTTDAAINNAVYATADTGDATVSGNGDGGNATTGDAEAIVNLINMINSAVATGQSFIGTININGDLNGNILIPQSLIDQILAFEGANSNSADNTTGLTNDESITNNIDADASSGSASVANNVNGGNATSGNANTGVTIMNLTGSSIVGQNVLLVFVNVLGQWVGMIVNAPAGATSAGFGGGITTDTPGTGNNAADADTNLSITNNVYADATSGNALVSQNFNGGNATSGNADTAVNILNVENSDLSLANWFGILFINVFGTWDGNFGILPTPAPATTPVEPSGATSSSNQQPGSYNGGYRLASYIATGNNDGASTPVVNDASAVLGDATTLPTANRIKSAILPSDETGNHDDYALPTIGFFLAALLILFSERSRFIRHKS